MLGYTFASLNLPTPKTDEDLVGATFRDPIGGDEVTVEAMTCFAAIDGRGWALYTDGGMFIIYA
jgi:hypothetical protein